MDKSINQWAMQLIPEYFGIKVTRFTRLRSFTDVNFHVQSINCEFVLKIFKNSFGVSEALLHSQFDAMRHLVGKGYTCPTPVKNLNGNEVTRICNATGTVTTATAEDCVVSNCDLVVLLTYVQGPEVLTHAPLSDRVLNLVGSFVAKLREDLMGYCDETISNSDENLWIMANFSGITKHLNIIKDKSDHRLVTEVIEAFQKTVIPLLDELENGIIHGDIHDENLIWILDTDMVDSATKLPTRTLNADIDATAEVATNELNDRNPAIGLVNSILDPESSPKRSTPTCQTNIDKLPLSLNAKNIFGLIDFGDMCKSACIFELTVTVAYFMMFSKRLDFLNVGSAIINGYRQEQTLTCADLKVFYISVCARYCQELVLGAVEAERQPESEYVRCGFTTGWPQVRQLWEMGEEVVSAIWLNE